MKVDFMIIGAQKCGTTTLFDTLSAHPAITGCRDKEPHFFSTCRDWRQQLTAYHKLYRGTPGTRYLEASTSYTFYPCRRLEIWNDLHEYNPALKFIYIARNPVERIISQYMHVIQRGYSAASIERELDGNRLYLEISRYHLQISPFIERFGPQQVLLLDFDDLIGDAAAVLRSVGDFLGIDGQQLASGGLVHSNASLASDKLHHRMDAVARPLKAFRRISPGLYNRLTGAANRRFTTKPRLSSTRRRMIVRELTADIDALQPLLGKDLSHWKA